MPVYPGALRVGDHSSRINSSDESPKFRLPDAQVGRVAALVPLRASVTSSLQRPERCEHRKVDAELASTLYAKTFICVVVVDSEPLARWRIAWPESSDELLMTNYSSRI
jgi:hypothetical protein